MKKQLFILVLFIGLCSLKSFSQGKSFAGVDLHFGSNDAASSFGISPKYGYWLSDDAAIVGGIIFNSDKNKTATPNVTTTQFGIGAAYRYGWHHGDHTFFYLAPGFNFLSSSTDISGSKSDSDFNIYLTPGVDYMMGDRWSINAEIGLLNFNSHTPGGGTAVTQFTVNTTMSNLTFGLWYHF